MDNDGVSAVEALIGGSGVSNSNISPKFTIKYTLPGFLRIFAFRFATVTVSGGNITFDGPDGSESKTTVST